MGEQCGADVPDDVDEYSRDDRIETYYQGWGAREMAERIVELEDEAEAAAVVESDRIAALDARDAEIERLRGVLLELDHRLSWHTTCKTCSRILDSAYEETMRAEAAESACDRYRLAWLSARRRAADEANFGMEALALRDEEIRRLRAELADPRKTTHAPRLEFCGSDEDGEVWRLA